MLPEPYDLTGRAAFVTGAASGIGRACATLLARSGATVHCADLHGKGLEDTVAHIVEGGGTAHGHRLDVTEHRQVRDAVKAAVRLSGGLDIAAAIAGIMHSATVLETREEDVDRVLSVNFKGVLFTCQESARAMIASQRPGSIITMASGAIDTAHPGLLCYGAAKAAVVQLTKTLATETGPLGLRVNAVAPGWIRTPMTERHGSEAQRAAEASMAQRSPLRRVGEVEDVAQAVLYLASDASSFMTGQVLRPNGGVTMPW
ncbi:SDR family NAD(P)-dependent oxidoreductase [Streptomyces sp. NPDC006879]|uniref:SDR family NAD(P)-dependent oxidoreductase n=1 Tax=Streptomyces sp. NPDC006879 TaxID=3364767 RepID=UPI003697CDF4